MITTINGRTPEEIKRGLECCYLDAFHCTDCVYLDICRVDLYALGLDALALIQQLEEDKKRLQERICNQRRSLRLLHAMYEWALGRLQKAKLNDRAHFQAFLRERGYDLATMELPETRYQRLEERIVDLNKTSEQLERERDAAEKDLEDAFDLIIKLALILKEYPNAATNGCAYEAYTEIKRFTDGLRGVQEVE